MAVKNVIFRLENQVGIGYYKLMKTISAVRVSLALLIMAGFLSLFQCSSQKRDFAALKADGEKALGSGEYNRAIENLKEASRLKPSDRDVLYNLGTAFAKLSLPDSAVTYFKRAKRLYPNDRPINKELIELCAVTGDHNGSLNAIAFMIASGDNEKMYWPLLAELNYRNENLYLASKYYQLLINDNPDENSYYLYLSGTLSQLGQFKESNDVLFRSIQLFGPRAESFANIAVNYISLKELDKAEEFMRKSLAVNPNNVPIWINLANLLSEQKDINKKKEALQIYKKYLKETPKAYKLDSLIIVLEKEIRGG